MANKVANTKNTGKSVKVPHPGMMGDGTEEQNLGQRGNPKARITKDDVNKAFDKKVSRK
jgi:hypothetical protein